MQIDDHLRRIREVYPDLPARDARPLGGGQYNDALVLNGDLVFRFPRFPEGVKALGREAAILAAIHGRVSLPVPAPLYISRDSDEVGRTFVGYRLIPGEPLTREALAAITDDTTLDRLSHQLAAFLRELHALPPQAIAYPLPPPDPVAQWAALHRRIREQLYPHMRPDARRDLDRHFAAFFDERANRTFRPALVHGDFGAGNILWDPRRGEVAGILDFSFARLDDPALDYAALSTYGEPFFARVLAVEPAVVAMLPRILFYRGTFAPQEALFGAEHGDRAAFEAGIAPYR